LHSLFSAVSGVVGQSVELLRASSDLESVQFSCAQELDRDTASHKKTDEFTPEDQHRSLISVLSANEVINAAS